VSQGARLITGSGQMGEGRRKTHLPHRTSKAATPRNLEKGKSWPWFYPLACGILGQAGTGVQACKHGGLGTLGS
jgi:hypothetical protein